MVASNALPPNCVLPQSWQVQIASAFEKLEVTPFPERGAYGKDPETWRDKCLPKYAALLRVLESMSVSRETSERICRPLLNKLKLALRPSTAELTEETVFIVTHGFRTYLRLSQAAGGLDATLRPLLQAAAPRFCHLLGFLEPLLACEQELARSCEDDSQTSRSSGASSPQESPLIQSLVANLSAPSHELRLVSLQILLTQSSVAPDQHYLLANMIQTEQTPFDLQSSRNIGVYLRKLGQSYASLTADSWLREAVPSFLFGILTVPLSPLWDYAIEALTRVAEAKNGEEAIATLASNWPKCSHPGGTETRSRRQSCRGHP